MTVSSGFFNSVSGDRKYNAKHFNEFFDGLICDGVYVNVGEAFKVTPGTGMQVLVGTGRGWFKNTWILNDASMPINLSSADPVYPRIDAIVIDVNTGTEVRNNNIVYVMGTAASAPDKPTLANEATHKQYPLAWVRVEAAATSITANKITDCQLTGELPAVEALLEYSSHTKAEIDARFERDEKPAFNESSTEDNIASGETIFIIFGKIQKFINIIKSKLPVKYGGTGQNSFTENSVILGNSANAMKNVPSNTGAFYSSGAGNVPQFGTLPVANGGTGATNAADALTNLGVPSDVAKAMSKDVYCSNDANRSIIDVAHGGTGTNNGTINGVRLMKSGNNMGYYDANGNFKTFRQPTGNATAAQVVSGYTFANASSDALTGTFAAQEKTVTSSRSAQTVTPDSGKYLSKVTVNKYPDANGTYACPTGWTGSPVTGGNGDMGASNNYRFVNATNVYNKGVADQKNVSWVEFRLFNFFATKHTAVYAGVDEFGGTFGVKNVSNLQLNDKAFVASGSVLVFINSSDQAVSTVNLYNMNVGTNISIPNGAQSVSVTCYLPSTLENNAYIEFRCTCVANILR